jgi:hypothetical protein
MSATVLGYAIAEKQWGNWTRNLFVCSLFIYSYSRCAQLWLKDHNVLHNVTRIFYGFRSTFRLYAHWLVCYTYLKVILDTRALLDKNIYFNNTDTLRQVSLHSFYLKLLSAFILVICVVQGYTSALATYPTDRTRDWIYKIGSFWI